MNRRKTLMRSLVLSTLACSLLLLAACSEDTPVRDTSANPKLGELKVRNATVFSEKVVSSGQPTEEDLAQAKEMGFTTIINLRTDGEDLGFDEQAAVEKLGMTYVHIPVKGVEGITLENADALRAALEAAKGYSLVHCQSANRCGGLFAVLAKARDGKSVEEALEIGKKGGMTRLEGPVRKLLEAME